MVFLDCPYWKCEVTAIEEVTHNVKMFCFKLPDSLVMSASVGQHVHLQRTISGFNNSILIALLFSPSLTLEISRGIPRLFYSVVLVTFNLVTFTDHINSYEHGHNNGARDWC